MKVRKLEDGHMVGTSILRDGKQVQYNIALCYKRDEFFKKDDYLYSFLGDDGSYFEAVSTHLKGFAGSGVDPRYILPRIPENVRIISKDISKINERVGRLVEEADRKIEIVRSIRRQNLEFIRELNDEYNNSFFNNEHSTVRLNAFFNTEDSLISETNRGVIFSPEIRVESKKTFLSTNYTFSKIFNKNRSINGHFINKIGSRDDAVKVVEKYKELTKEIREKVRIWNEGV